MTKQQRPKQKVYLPCPKCGSKKWATIFRLVPLDGEEDTYYRCGECRYETARKEEVIEN